MFKHRDTAQEEEELNNVKVAVGVTAETRLKSSATLLGSKLYNGPVTIPKTSIMRAPLEEDQRDSLFPVNRT